MAVFRLEAEAGKRRMDDLKEIEEYTRAQKGGLLGSVVVSDGFFPVQGRGRRSHKGRRDGRHPAGRLGKGLRGHPGMQRGRRDDGLCGPEALQTLSVLTMGAGTSRPHTFLACRCEPLRKLSQMILGIWKGRENRGGLHSAARRFLLTNNTPKNIIVKS